MPRQARLRAPETLHTVTVRGIEKRRIGADEKDRGTCLARRGEAAAATGMVIYAWALLTNPAHLLLRSGPQGMPAFMCNRRAQESVCTGRRPPPPSLPTEVVRKTREKYLEAYARLLGKPAPFA